MSKKNKIDDLSDVNFDFVGSKMDMSLIDKVINKPEEEKKETPSTIEKTKEAVKNQPPPIFKPENKVIKPIPAKNDEVAPVEEIKEKESNDVLINIDLDKYQDDTTKRKQVLLHPEIYSRLNNFKSDMYKKNKIRIEYVDFVNKVIDQVLKHYGH